MMDAKTLEEYLVEFGVKIGFLTPEKAEQLLKECPHIEKVVKGLECHRIDNNHRINCADCPYYVNDDNHINCVNDLHDDAIGLLKEQIPDSSKYQYKYDHTDCIWYHDSRSKCPVTCSQYRDGWNDAMDYIFKDGKGYSPYERRRSVNE